jgi:superfamily II DNA or RNA helicase/HKD family nuclease
LIREIAQQIGLSLEDPHIGGEQPSLSAEILQAIRRQSADGKSYEEIEAPLTPLLDTALLSNSPGEPALTRQLLSEIDSADRIDLIVAFVRKSGIRPLRDALRRHVEHGRALRLLTTTFTGTTQPEALEELAELGAEIRVSYDTGAERLHAKAWIFERANAYSTAYIGSSNLTRHGTVTGHEWNLRVSGARNPDVLHKMHALFEGLWEGGDFVPFDAKQFADETARHASDSSPDRPRILLSGIELRPEPFQARMLEQLELARQRGQHKNLLVSATGTGKTVMAALDYAELRRQLPSARLLFVAHRKEILEQSWGTFCYALQDSSFGELWVDGQRPRDFHHVFASIQSLNAHDLDRLDPEHFDVLIVDEFHHAAAKSYEKLLSLLRPKELLGLTATPERSDGESILQHFEGRITAELRLWDAIDRQYLSPFAYYGIHDEVDLRDITWRRGRGYDSQELEQLLTANDAWAGQVVRQVLDHVEDAGRFRALGFCVGVRHAEFMARFFDERGLPARAVTGQTPASEREEALRALADGKLRALFSVDVFGEGVDVPDVDTLLFLRPTDSPVLFLQQLGRGLRKSRSKSHCTVLDFVGQHRKEFRFDRRLRALLGGTRRQIEKQVTEGFPWLPAGCHMQLDRKSQHIVLQSIRNAVPTRWNDKVEELRQIAATESGRITLPRYLEASGLELNELYSSSGNGQACWSDLRESAGLDTAAHGEHEPVLRRALGRLLHVDDKLRIDAWRKTLSAARPPQLHGESPPAAQRRLLHMLIGQLFSQVAHKSTTLGQALHWLWQHPAIRAEVLELLDVLEPQIDHVQAALDARDIPLRVHARYTRIEILSAFGIAKRAKVPAWQTGVYFAAEARADLLAFTLDKTSGGFSPSTRYEDYAINAERIHWQSQNIAHPGTPAGHRYIHHASEGSSIHLFARENTATTAFWYLGPATYVRHEGERPMAITWQLQHALSGDLLATMRTAVA